MDACISRAHRLCGQHNPHQTPRAARRGMAIALVLAVCFGVSSTSSAASPCPNDAIRSQQGSLSLPDCRAYEMVSPPDKNGGNLALGLTSTADGSRVASTASASFADPHSNELNAPYISTRTGTGWQTVNLSPPLPGGFGVNGYLQTGAFTADLSTAIVTTRASAEEPEWKNIFVTTIGGETTWVTEPTQPNPTPADKLLTGHSDDGSRIFFESSQSYSASDTFGASQIWEWHLGQVQLVSVLPDSSVSPNGGVVGTGVNRVGSESTATFQMLPEPTAVSSDGSRVFFTAPTEHGPQLFVREDGTTTKEVSLSQKPGSVGEEVAGGVTFLGAATDGSKVLFVSSGQLVADATPGGGIYGYDVDSGKLEFLTPDGVGGGDPQFQGVAAVSADAGRVYFVADAQLVPGEGQPGAHNLYYADRDGVRFIATLAEADKQNWSNQPEPRTSRITPDGAHIAFQSVNPLTGYDQGDNAEIFKWDLATGALECVSCGPVGSSAQGFASLLSNPVDPETGIPVNNQDQEGDPRGLSEDGSRVFFQTTDSLDPHDVNGKTDVYAWEEGQTHLISSGTGARDSEIVDSAADGRDVFFSTSDSLVAGDIDGGAQDIYDARIDGGFAEPQVPSDCEGGDCQGAASPPPPFRVSGSAQVHRPANRRAARLRRALRACAHKKAKRARKKCRAAAKRRYGADRATASTAKGA